MSLNSSSNDSSYGWFDYFLIILWAACLGVYDAFGNLLDNLLQLIFYNDKVSFHRRRALLPDNLKDKTVVITGGNSGIGKETAKVCARLGARVILACRNQTKAQEAVVEIVAQKGVQPEQLLLVPLDLASLSSVQKCAHEIDRLTDRIDVLINNAGSITLSNLQTKDGIEYTFAVNYLGHFLLTNLLAPKLKAAPVARIVNVSSLAWYFGSLHLENNFNLNAGFFYNPFSAYPQSKLAQILFTRELAKLFTQKAETKHPQLKNLKQKISELENPSITVYAVHPGLVRSSFLDNLPPLLRELVWILGWSFMIPVESGAQTSLHCAFSEEAGQETGLYYENCRQVKKTPNHGCDDEQAARLWDQSVKLCENYLL